MNKDELKNKRQSVVDRYLELKSMQSVATEFSLSRERVRQICTEMIGKEKINEIKTENKKNTVSRLKENYISERGQARYDLMLLRRGNKKKFAEQIANGTRFSLLFDACQSCGSTTRKHFAKGLCGRCYKRERYKDPEVRRRQAEASKRYEEKRRLNKT